MFRHHEDRLPVAIFVALASVDAAVYLLVDELWILACYFLLMTLPKGLCSSWNHHHQHVPTFRSRVLNRLLEQLYALHTGMPTNMWVLHHVLGHHLNYLDQSRDESRWQRADGSTMGELEYTLRTVLMGYPYTIAVGLRHPRVLRPFLIYGAITWSIAAALTWARPMQGLMVYLLPMVGTMFYTAWVTYEHHAGLDTDDPFGASKNILNPWFNRLTGNLGYHTAHHYRQGIHWSRLPELHAQIEHRIPAHCFAATLFDAVLPGADP